MENFNAHLESLRCNQQQSPISRRGMRAENSSNLRPKERLDTADDCLCPNHTDRAQKLSLFMAHRFTAEEEKLSIFASELSIFEEASLCSPTHHITMMVASNCVRCYHNVALFKKLFAVWFVLNKAGGWLARNLSCQRVFFASLALLRRRTWVKHFKFINFHSRE